jgi:hypothetical protein
VRCLCRKDTETKGKQKNLNRDLSDFSLPSPYVKCSQSKIVRILEKILVCSTWRKNDEILQQLYHEHKYLIILWKGEVVVGDCGLEGGILAIYWQTENELHLRWGVGVHLRHGLPHIWEPGSKTGGSIWRKADWGVHEPQFLALSHTCTHPHHLGRGSSRGRLLEVALGR